MGVLPRTSFVRMGKCMIGCCMVVCLLVLAVMSTSIMISPLILVSSFLVYVRPMGLYTMWKLIDALGHALAVTS